MGGTIIVPAADQTFPGSGTLTFAQLKSDIGRISGILDDPGMLELAGRFVNDVVDDLNRRQTYLFNLVTSPTITTVPGQQAYSIPDDFLRVYNARKTDGIDYQLTILGQKTFDTLFVSQRNINGLPYTLNIRNAFRDGTVSLFPTPDGVYQISVNYFKLIPRLTQDSDTLDMPVQFESIVAHGARSRMLATLSQYDGAKYWNELYEQGYQVMKRFDEDDSGDEELRFIQIEEILSRSYSFINPASRPRALDLF